jgi:hypothetical protein
MRLLQEQGAAAAIGCGGGVLLCVRACCCCVREGPRAGLMQLRLLSSWCGMWAAVTDRLY